jgi:predicted amidophosphoribosyltransferase
MILENLREITEGLRSLVFPELCLICEKEFVAICRDCAVPWHSTPTRFAIKSLDIYSTVPYSAEVSSVVLKAKEDGLRIAQKLMANALTRSIVLWGEMVDLSDCVLVPIPSTRRAIRRRGGSFLHPILEISTSQLKRKGFTGVQWIELLKHHKSVQDQSELSYEERKANLRDAFKIFKSDRELMAMADKQIILVDDVVTSGATLLSAESTLRERKMTILGAATACASAHHLLIR